MITRTQELCRKLKPILGRKVDALWSAYLAAPDADGKADVEQTLELLASKHLGQSYQPDRSPFPPPDRTFAMRGDLKLGTISYGNRNLYPFWLSSHRLKEHALVAGRSGSGKTNLTFMLMLGAMDQGIHILALDWKRGYRDLLSIRPGLKVYTIGRDISPFRFNPLIPPAGCEPHVWIKLVVEVIANAYLGGEGVISLLTAGLDHMYSQAGVYDGTVTFWPSIPDLLAWLRSVKLKGRAAMWQASAERILLAMMYGEFGAVVNTQSNAHVAELLDHNVILEMDGLSSSSDKTMFSEALTLYLYRHRLARGPQSKLTNLIVLEEAHNLLLQKQAEARESVLESSIRMIRQYGIGYVFVDQSPSLISKVAFANSYATIALSQKLRADVQTITGAMNLTEEQRDALSTLPIGTAVIRLADEHPEAFLVKLPRCPIQEGSVPDERIREHMAADIARSAANNAPRIQRTAITPVPLPDKINNHSESPHPPSPSMSSSNTPTLPAGKDDAGNQPPAKAMNREELRFLADIAARPVSTTVSRYQRLHLSRRKGNAIRQSLAGARLIEPVVIPTRSGQIVLYQLTETGRAACAANGFEPGPPPRASLEHQYWVGKVAEHFEKQGYSLSHEHVIAGNGAIDLLAERPGERVAIEVETGKSDIRENIRKVQEAGFDRVVLLATSPTAVGACQQAISDAGTDKTTVPELMTWLDL